MKRLFLLTIALVFLFSGIAHALLWDRGGGMIYDDVLDITWLQDVNYAGFEMSWDDAVAWTDSLEYGGYDNWRLPDARNQDGSGPDTGYYVTGSEMGHMFYNNLGGSPGSFPSMTFIDGNGDSVSFLIYWRGANLWYGNEWEFNDTGWSAWYFVFSNTASSGQQHGDSKFLTYNAWAVRDGDVAPIPEPSTLLLLGSASLFGAAFRKRFRK
jgi:hypothetical protein